MLELNLKGKTAIITGAAGNLGHVMALTLAECGANVIVHSYSQKAKAEALAEQIRGTYGVKAFNVTADVGDLDSVMAMKKQIEENFILPEIVVTNAVASYKWATILEQDTADYEKEFRTCVLQNVNMVKAFVPHMIEIQYGKYVGINTEHAMQCKVTGSAYDSGKRGMDGILRVLAKEVGKHNITVNQVAPGWIITDKDRLNHTEKSPSYEADVPLGHRGTDQDIADAVAFLSSDLSKFISGVYLPVSGGLVMPAI